MGAEFEEFLVEGQLFRRYTKRDNLPSCRFVEGKARALTEISIPEKPKKGRLSRDTAGDVRRNADIYTVADKNLKNELTKNLPTGFDWKAPDVEDKLESHREALANCFPDWVSKELKEGLMDILNQNFLLQKMSGNQLRTYLDKADPTLVVTPTPKLWAIVFTDANTAEITEVAEVRSYFIVDDNGIPLGEPKNALEEAPAFLIITTTQRVSMVDRRLTVEYTHMTNEVKVSEERLCNAVGSLLSDEGLGLVDSNLMNKFHALAQGDASSSIKAFAKHITETMKYGYPSWQTPEDRNKTSEYLAELEKNLIKIQELEQAGFNDTAALYAVLCELVRCADGCDIHMNLSVSSSFYLKISDIISNLDASPYVKARALFIMILEHYYIGIQSSLNNYCQENLQTPDSIYTAGQQLFVAAGKAFESAPTEVTGYLTTVVKYATKQLQPLIEPTVKNSSVLPTTPQKCSDEEYQEAKTKLQAAGYDKVVSSATKFLEAVATAIVNRFLSTVVAIASLGPSLMPSCANLLFGSACGHGYINWTTGASFLAPNPSNRRPQAQSNSPAPAA